MGKITTLLQLRKRFWSILYWIFALGNILLALYGIYSIFLFILVILGIAGALYRISNTKRTEVGLLIIALSLIIIVGELSLRTVDNLQSYSESAGSIFYRSPFNHFINTNRGWVHIRTPNITKSGKRTEYSYTLTTNSDGLRDINHNSSKGANQYRIVALGDSFTEGLSVSSLEKTWVKLLQQKLTTKYKDTRVEVFNGGVAGSDPFFELVLLKDKLLKYHPDLVIVSINRSDLDDVAMRGGNERFRADSTVTFKSGPWYEPLFGMSYIARLVIFNTLNQDWFFRTGEERNISQKKSQILIFECLKAFQALGEQNSFKLLVILQPMEDELKTNTFGLDYLEALLAPSINTVNLSNAFNVEIKKKQLFWPIDKHFTEAGNEVYATLLFEEIIKHPFIR